MPITDLFRQTVTLVRVTATTPDEIGGVASETTTTTTVQGYLEPRNDARIGFTEDLSDRGTLVGDWLGFFPPDTDLSGWDRIEYDGHGFEVLGPPRPFYDPSAGGNDHIEVDLREVR